MIAECGHLVVVNVELVWDVDSEALLCDLEGEENSSALLEHLLQQPEEERRERQVSR